MGWLPGTLQALGAVGLAVGLFVVLPWGLALAIVGTLAVAGGTVLEIGARPRQVPAPSPVERRITSVDDLRRTASER